MSTDNKDKVKILYNALIEDGYSNLGDEDNFRRILSDRKGREAVYSAIAPEYGNIGGTIDEFEGIFGLGSPASVAQQAQTPRDRRQIFLDEVTGGRGFSTSPVFATREVRPEDNEETGQAARSAVPTTIVRPKVNSSGAPTPELEEAQVYVSKSTGRQYDPNNPDDVDDVIRGIQTSEVMPTGSGEVIRGFGGGFAQGLDAIYQGIKTFAGEAANNLPGVESAQIYKDAVKIANDKIEELRRTRVRPDGKAYRLSDKEVYDSLLEWAQGESLSSEEANKLHKKIDRAKSIGVSLPGGGSVGQSLGRDRDTENAVEALSRDQAIKAIISSIGEAGEDKFRSSLRGKYDERKSIGDMLMDSAEEGRRGHKRTEGTAAWIGNLASSSAGTLLGVAVGAINPSAGAAIGAATMGALTASSAGNAMAEAREYGATNEQIWGAGIMAGAIEYATERIPFERYFGGVNKLGGKVLGRVARESQRKAVAEMTQSLVGKLSSSAVSPARKELAKVLSKANKQLGGKLFGGRTLANYMIDVAAEGASEFLAEGLGAIVPIIYRDREDYPTLREIIDSGIEGFYGGAIMGAAISGVGRVGNHYRQRDRRKQQGEVYIASIKDKKGEDDGLVEIVGSDNSGHYSVLRKSGGVDTIDEDQIQDGYTFSFKEWDRGVLMEDAEEAYEAGQQMTQPQNMNDAMNLMEVRRELLRNAFSIPDGDEDSDIFDDPLGVLEVLGDGISDEQRSAVVDYANALSTYNGIIDRRKAEIQERVSAAHEAIQRNMHKDTGMVQTATLKDGDRRVYIIRGNVERLPDGAGVNVGKSSRFIVVRDAETGEIKSIDPRAILSLDDAIDPKEEMLEIETSISREMAQASADQIDGGEPLSIGSQYAMLDGAGNRSVETVLAANDDGTIVMRNADGGSIVRHQSEVYDMINRRKRAEIMEQITRGAGSSVQPSGGAYSISEKITIRGSDGNLLEAEVVQEEDADGMIHIQTTDPDSGKQRVMAVPRSDLDRMVVGRTNVAGQSGDVVNDAPTSVLSRIPKDDKGAYNYRSATPEDAWDGMIEEFGDEDVAMDVALAQVQQADKTLKKAEGALNSKRGITGTPQEMAAKSKAMRQAVKDAQGDLDHWTAVSGVLGSRAAAQKTEEAATPIQDLGDKTSKAEEIVVPEWSNDKASDARARGYRIASSSRVERNSEGVASHVGADVDVKFANDKTVPAKYAVIEAQSLQPSHVQGNRNPMFFLDEAQPKDRTDGASVLSAQKIAASINPAEITNGITAYTGSPVTNSRGEVIQGNNRSDALRYMYEYAPQSAEAYRSWLEEHSADFGLSSEDVSGMEHPVLVRMADVSDADAINLGQYTSQDTESGGVERIKVSNTLNKLGGNVRSFANILMRSDDPDASITELIRSNGAETLRWLHQGSYISDTQLTSAFNGRGDLTEDAVSDLRDILFGSVFSNAPTGLRQAFSSLPAKAQKAILATAYRDLQSDAGQKVVAEVQASIMAFAEMQENSEAFRKSKTTEDALMAIEEWRVQQEFDPETGDLYLPVERLGFSNFATTMAAYYKGRTQRFIQETYNELYDAIQGVAVGLFDDGSSSSKSVSEAVKNVLGIDYDGTIGIADDGEHHQKSQDGGQGGPGDTRGDEPSEGEVREDEHRGGVDADLGAVDNQDDGGTEEASTEDVPSSDSNSLSSDLNSKDNLVSQAEEDVDRQPTQAQKDAGNYKKGHVTIDGLNISIEQPKGSERTGVDKNGTPWSVTMSNTYGYIRGTEGVDGDHIDVFLSDNLDGWDGDVYVVDQVNSDGEFDEHKVMYGFSSLDEAREAYLSNYSPGWNGLGNITPISKQGFKEWINSSKRKTKPFSDYKIVQKRSDEASQSDGDEIRFRDVDHPNKYEQELEEIKSKAQADGTFMLAPNGKPTRLNERQWLQVRTKAFKEWFGDWEKSARIEKLRKSEPVVISGTEIEPSEDIKQYKKNALEYGKRLQGSYVNQDTGKTISLQRGRKRGGVNEVLQHDYKDAEHLQSIAAIPGIIEQSIYIDSVENEGNKVDADSFDYYVAGVRIAGVDYTVRAVIVNTKNGETYYDHKLSSIEKGNLLDLIAGQGDNHSDFGTTPDPKSTITDISDVKDTRLISLLQNDASKVIDENGEPMVVYHGTSVNNRRFFKFKSGYPIWVTPSKQYAQAFTRDHKKPVVYEVFVKADSPAYVGYIDGDVTDEDLTRISDSLGVALEELKSISSSIDADKLYHITNSEEFLSLVRSMGYDSMRAFEGRMTSYAVFSSEQIKSATDNVGSFDGEDADIRFRNVYHGSPYSFDSFDHSKIGTGEGYQAYGWGTYVTEVDGIAKSYASSLYDKSIARERENTNKYDHQIKTKRHIENLIEIGRDTINDLKETVERAKKYLDEEGSESINYRNAFFPYSFSSIDEVNNRISSIERTLKMYETRLSSYPSDKELLDKRNEAAAIEYDRISKLHRNFYTVDIPNEEGGNYLRWEDELTQDESMDIYDSLVAYIEGRDDINIEDYHGTIGATGSEVYNDVSDFLGGDKEASIFFSRMGYVGVSYPSEYLSGGREDGSRNYVIFKESDAKIIEHERFRKGGNRLVSTGNAGDAKEAVSSLPLDTEVAVVDVPHLGLTHDEAIEVINNLPSEIDARNTPEGVETLRISRKTRNKLANHLSKMSSELREAYMDMLSYLEEVISNSLLLEEHRDRVKNSEGKRLAENDSDPNIDKVQRLYGAVRIGDKVYRVKTTAQVFAIPNIGSKLHHYDITQIELLESSIDDTPIESNHHRTSNSSIESLIPTAGAPINGGSHPLPINDSVSIAKLIDGVELSYNTGVQLADAMREARGKVAPQLRSNNTGDNQKSASEQQAYSERAVELGRELGVPVRVIHNTEDIAHKNAKTQTRMRRAKGWFDPSTGEVVVVVPNADSVSDVEATIYHEIVGHKGLRQVVGDKAFNGFLHDVYRNMPNAAKSEVTQSFLSGKYRSLEEATEEYIARLAEQGFGQERSMLRRVLDKLRDFLRNTIGLDLAFTDNDLRYILWKSYHLRQRQGIMEQAKDIELQQKLGVGRFRNSDGTNTQEVHGVEMTEHLRYRSGDSPSSSENTARDKYEKATRGMGKKITINDHENFTRRIIEDVQNEMISLKKLQDFIVEETGGKLESFEDAYTAENQLSSRNKAEGEVFVRDFQKPIMDSVFDLINGGSSYDEIRTYMMAKHGLERNRVFSERDAVKDGGLWDGSVGDYSGLRSLTGSEDGFTQAAEEIVSQFERKHGDEKIGRLWSRINAANKAVLNKSLKSGMMSRKVFDKVSKMFEYYIPLRGWQDDVASEEYQYMTRGRGFGNVLKKAEGRGSIADDPIATMFYMAHSAISSGNSNIVKQRLLNLAINKPTSLLSVHGQWYVKDADGTWSQRSPEIPEDASAERIEEIISEFEEQMASLREKGLATTQNEGLQLSKHATNAQKREHAIRVFRNGEERVIYVNGNPRAAQAINGALHENIVSWANKVKSFMSQNFTSRNPAFVAVNLSRDVLWASAAISIKEEKPYRKAYYKNLGEVLTKAKLVSLLQKWNDGTLDENNEIEKRFKEFLLNGGETGFTQVNTIDHYKRDINRFVKEAENGKNHLKAGANAILSGVEFLNRAAEDTTRFAVFLTSRQMGRDIQQSISDAKEVTVNFNRHGSGRGWSKWVTFAYVFFNASLQSSANMLRLMKHHPKRSAALISKFIALGMTIPALNMLASLILGDDEDYWNLPEHIRRNNIVLRVPFGFAGTGFIMIPLPHEIRAFYGASEAAFSALLGKDTVEDALLSAVSGFAGMLPLDITGNGGNILSTLSPTAAQPLVQLGQNVNYFGMPIYKSSEYMEDYPGHKKAYKGTSPWLIDATRVINELGGGDDVSSGGLLDWNPAGIEHLVKGYFGGAGDMLTKSAKTFSMIWDEDMRDARNIPIISRFYYEADDRAKNRKIDNSYFDALDDARDVEHKINGYRKEAMKGSSRYEKKLEDLLNSDEYKRMQIAVVYSSMIKSIREASIYGGSDMPQEEIDKQVVKMKTEMLEELKRLDDNK